MKTKRLKRKNEYDVTDYCKDYTGAFHDLYFNFELSEDKGFKADIQEKYNLDSWQYQSVKTEVSTKLKQYETEQKKKKNKLEELLAITEFENKRHKYKVHQKIAYVKNGIGRAITFGTRALLSTISFLSNPVKRQKENRIRIRKLKRAKKEYKENRLLAITIIGEAPQKSNRKFDFDFVNKKVVFKPKAGVKIPIEFYCNDSLHKELVQLQSQVGEQSITVKLDNDYIWITYDEQKLNGFAFNEKEYFNELKTIPKANEKKRKLCGKKWMIEQEHRMFSNKKSNRFIGFDLNPEYVSFAIVDRLNRKDDKFKIIYLECINLTNLNTKMNLSSDDLMQIKQNNKRIYELGCVWKYIFEVAKHFQVANCSVENLFFKQELVNQKSTEANRKTLNIWHRTKTINLITKHCNTIGIKLIGVNACYSTFIGNIKHGFFDPVNSAIEVARRGIAKYLGKKFFYPPLERSDFDTMNHFFGLDVQNKTVSTWIKAFKLFKDAELRYRRELPKGDSLSDRNLEIPLGSFIQRNFMSSKSRTISYVFA